VTTGCVTLYTQDDGEGLEFNTSVDVCVRVMCCYVCPLVPDNERWYTQDEEVAVRAIIA